MWYLYGFAVLAGLANAIQPGQNAMLGKTLERPFLAALVTLAVGFVVTVAIALAAGGLSWPASGKAASVPWWAWLGGFCGCAVLLAQAFVSQQIGAAVFLGIVVTVGTVTSVLLDHFGWLGFQQHAAGIGRIAGAALMIAGVALIAAF